jgi:hypothetical protein
MYKSTILWRMWFINCIYVHTDIDEQIICKFFIMMYRINIWIKATWTIKKKNGKEKGKEAKPEGELQTLRGDPHPR